MAIPGVVTGPGSVVNHLPGSMRIKLIQGNDFSTTIQIGANDIQLDGSKLFVPKDLTGCTFEVFIAGHNQRATAKSTAPVTGMVTLLIPHSMTASMHGEVAFELVEIDPVFTRRTLIQGVIESRGICETTDCGGCGQSHESCRCKCDWCNGPRHSCGCHGHTNHHHDASHPTSEPRQVLVPCNPTGVISLNGKTGSLTTDDVDLIATANVPGFIKPDGVTTFIDANGTLRAVGGGGGGGNGTGSSYVLPAATSSTLGGVIVGGGLKVAAGGILTAQIATSSQSGMVKPGSLISILTDGTIDVAGVPSHTHPISEVRTLQTELDSRPVLTGGKLPVSTLPLASASAAGAVKIDGTSVVLDANGAISAVTAGALGGTVTSVGFGFDTASDAIFSVTGVPVTKAGTITIALEPQAAHSVFAGPTAGGNGFPVFRSLTGDDISDATATGLSLLRVANQAAVKTVLGLANVSSSGSYTDLVDKPHIPATYNLPVATTVTLGGVIVDGTTITVDANGKIKGSNSYVLPIANLTTVGGVKQGANITIDATGVISTVLPANYTLPIANTTGLGGVKQGSNVTIDGTGLLSVSFPANYSLPIANTTVLGGVKQGSNVTIDSAGLLSVNLPAGYTLPVANATRLGGVIPSGNITVLANGTIDANLAGYLTQGTANTLYQPIGGGLQTLADAASIAWALDPSKIATVTLGGSRTLANPTNKAAGGTYLLIVKQDATGSRTLAYGTEYKFPSGIKPIMPTAPNSVTILTFVTDGVNMYGLSQGDFK